MTALPPAACLSPPSLLHPALSITQKTCQIVFHSSSKKLTGCLGLDDEGGHGKPASRFHQRCTAPSESGVEQGGDDCKQASSAWCNLAEPCVLQLADTRSPSSFVWKNPLATKMHILMLRAVAWLL